MQDKKQLVEIFRNSGGFGRLFDLYRKKFESYGAFGTVQMRPSGEEEKALRGFLGVRYKGPRFPAADFERAAEEAGYSVSMLELLELYYGRQLSTKREEAEQLARERESLLSMWKGQFSAPLPQTVLEGLVLEKESCRPLFTTFHNQISTFTKCFPTVLQVLMNAPYSPVMRLPMLGSKFLKNPHAFDHDTDLWRLLLDSLIALERDKGRDMLPRSEMNAEEIAALFLDYGLVKNDLNNKVTVLGVLAEFKDGPCRKLNGAIAAGSYLDLSLRDIGKYLSARPYKGDRVYIIENPVVFSSILDEWEGKEDIPVVVCTYGQPRLSALRLFDLMVKTNPRLSLWYSGDFDPEGIMMLQRLMNRYKGGVTPWRYAVTDYIHSKPSVPITEERRIRQLDVVSSSKLRPLAEELKDCRLAGYQEGIQDLLLRDLSSM